MEEGKVFNITPPEKGYCEVTFREGEALPAKANRDIRISGILGAPYQFYEGKKAMIDPLTSHITIKKDLGVITLNVDDQNAYTEIQVIGQLKKDGALAPWDINGNKRWTVGELLKFIKTQRYYFNDTAECSALVASLQTWNAKVETVIKQHNDNAGNSLQLLEKKVSEIGLKTRFNLHIPLFQGYPKVKFTVEIGFDPKTNSVDLYLISDELFELEIQEREKHIDAELAKFADFHCSKVVIS
jgi:hypothetical protein